MKVRTESLLGMVLSVLMLLFTSCQNDEADGGTTVSAVRHRIAVICPAEMAGSWKQTASWALENIRKAQAGLSRQIELDIEWIDEDAADLAQKASSIATGGEYELIVGPYSSSKAHSVALQVEGRIPMLLPCVTSTEMQRVYGGHNGLWFFTQSDITQSEILLTQAKLAEKSHVALITTDDEYGQSFSDWFSYQAIELGLTVDEMFVCRSSDDVVKAVSTLNGQKGWYDKALILAPSEASMLEAFDGEIGKLKAALQAHEYLEFPDVLCSDVVNTSANRARLKNIVYEGISPSADPRSGWLPAYVSKFGAEPAGGEAQLYDALMLTAFAICSRHDAETLNEAIMRVVDGRDGDVCDGWTAADLQTTFARLASGGSPDIRGVTSDWTWDAKFHNSVTGTFYSHWAFDGDGRFTTLEYLTLNGADGSISTVQAWDWATTYQQTFDTDQKDLSYVPLNDRYAVVVGASDTWINYRHQADALAFYQLLKSNGYDDDHIILIMEDNIANNPLNKRPGEVRVTLDGENLYHDVDVDYHLSDISVSDLKDIMSGKKTDRLSRVIQPTASDNIIMFWCGHGASHTLMWGGHTSVYGSDMSRLISNLQQEGRFRKFMFVLDACYSGTIGEACEGIPGTLVFTAAHAFESSKADIYDNTLNVWLSNGFTRTFRDEVTANPDITLRELYYKTVRGTKGSHPRIYNASNYGNMYRESLREFL